MEIQLPQPEQKIFENNISPTLQITRETQSVYWIDRTEYPDEGGIYVYKFGAELLPQQTVTPERLDILKAKGEKILLQLRELLGNEFVLVPNGSQVSLTPTEIFEITQLKPDLKTRIPLLYPEKGFPTPEALWACNMAKRFLINELKTFLKLKLLLFTPHKIKRFNEWLVGYNELSKIALESYYLQDNRYTPICQELRILISEFLKGIGVEQADDFAKTFATLIQYDSAYRYRIEDILSETTKEKILENPRREIKKLLQIFAQREILRPHLVQKFKWIGQILSAILLVPKIKKAFKNALNKIDFTKMQLDEAGRYWVLMLDGYEFLGRPIEDRIKEYVNLHKGNAPRVINIHT